MGDSRLTRVKTSSCCNFHFGGKLHRCDGTNPFFWVYGLASRHVQMLRPAGVDEFGPCTISAGTDALKTHVYMYPQIVDADSERVLQLGLRLRFRCFYSICESSCFPAELWPTQYVRQMAPIVMDRDRSRGRVKKVLMVFQAFGISASSFVFALRMFFLFWLMSKYIWYLLQL